MCLECLEQKIWIEPRLKKLVSRKKKIDILPKYENVNILALRFMKLSIYWSITNLMHLMSRLYSERIQWKFIGEKNASLSLLASFHSPQHFFVYSSLYVRYPFIFAQSRIWNIWPDSFYPIKIFDDVYHEKRIKF